MGVPLFGGKDIARVSVHVVATKDLISTTSAGSRSRCPTPEGAQPEPLDRASRESRGVPRVSVAHLEQNDATSFIFDARLRNLTRSGSGTIIAYVTFTSIQAAECGPNGETCDRWTLDYTMQLVGTRWLIDGAHAHAGSTNGPC